MRALKSLFCLGRPEAKNTSIRTSVRFDGKPSNRARSADASAENPQRGFFDGLERRLCYGAVCISAFCLQWEVYHAHGDLSMRFRASSCRLTTTSPFCVTFFGEIFRGEKAALPFSPRMTAAQTVPRDAANALRCSENAQKQRAKSARYD